jgi:integrase
MSTLSKELDRYLSVRRGLGYELRSTERILQRFVAFAERQDADHITARLFLRWQETIGPAAPQTRAGHLGAVRPFAAWLHSLDPTHEVLPGSLVPYRRRRPLPYIYSAENIRRIVDAASTLPSINGIRPLTCAVLFGLLAVTGMRVSEALALDADDVDLEAGVLTVRRGKRGKTRLLPLAGSTTAHLAAYATERDRLLGYRSEAFFVSERGTRLTDCGARYNFAVVCQRIGLRPATKFNRHGRGPRIHDLRHSFAVRTLIDWYRTGKDPAREMLKLSTYLGHADPANTYWYIEAVPELLELAAARFERFATAPSGEQS